MALSTSSKLRTDTAASSAAPGQLAWSQQYALRRAAAEQFGTIFELPLAKHLRDVLVSSVPPGSRVLEVGAGDRRMGQLLAERCGGIEYRSMDIDRRMPHEYYSLDEITQHFDCIYSLEVIEHLPLAEIMPFLEKLSSLMDVGGRLLLSTPNTYYPPAYLRDVTHQTPLCYDELAALVTAAGFEVTRIVRIYNDPLHRWILRRFAFGWLFRLLGIDFARQIVLIASKPAPAEPKSL